ncbi:MAG: hypothetical protein KatS3mg124_1191 [Porticoccaceae bacterium]|nr:MAG: hypothetical protein KatS3mg124_1191 [Porticoccaceae bacterium]
MGREVEFAPIRVEEVAWGAEQPALRAIREAVFVAEQGFAAAGEFDAADPQARHWLAWVDGRPAGTVRLVGERVGRLAVLPQYRRQGVGSALLRAAIAAAKGAGLTRLVLHAQLPAVDFYRRFGFEPRGEPFPEDGVPHQAMALDLGAHQQRTAAERRRAAAAPRRLAGAEACHAALVALAQGASRRLTILSHRLAPPLYDSADLAAAAEALALRHPAARVEILVAETEALGRGHHRLLEAAQRWPSRIQILRLPRDEEPERPEFAVADERALWLLEDPERFQGLLLTDAPRRARLLAEAFARLWERGEPDPALRRLYL